MAAPPLPRVVWVEDDAAVQRLIQLVLEDQPLQLVLCASVRAALAALRQGPAALVVTDLMLPDEPGTALLARLAAAPELRGSARLAVFSAGLNQALRSQLLGLGVWRVLAKPASVAELAACVRDALAAVPAEPSVTLAIAEQIPSINEPVDAFFGGDQALYQAYQRTCLARFPLDIQLGDAALATGDLPALLRLAHSLKTVLATLGHPLPAEIAATLERHAASAATALAADHWARLRQALEAVSLHD